MKWIIILLNLIAIFALVGLRQYAHGYHRMETEDAYQGLVSRGLLDEAKSAEYARLHNGWHPRQRLQSIGNPDGFVQSIFVIGVGTCLLNSAAVFYLSRGRGRRIAEPSASPNGGPATQLGNSGVTEGPPSVS
jgi:hypothetical protein